MFQMLIRVLALAVALVLLAPTPAQARPTYDQIAAAQSTSCEAPVSQEAAVALRHDVDASGERAQDCVFCLIQPSCSLLRCPIGFRCKEKPQTCNSCGSAECVPEREWW